MLLWPQCWLVGASLALYVQKKPLCSVCSIWHFFIDHNWEGKQEVQNQQDSWRMKLSSSYSQCRLSYILVKGSRPLLQLTLASIFLFFFGIPAIKQYLAKEVMVVKTMRDSGGKISAPSISINARNPKNKRGWKVDDTWKYLERCLRRNQSADTCIENETYNQREVFNNVFLGYTRMLSLMNSTNLWRKDFTRTDQGTFFTFNFTLHVGPDLWTDRLIFELSYNLEYRIFIHDPNYFVITSNDAYFPIIKLSINPNTAQSFFLNFDLTEVVTPPPVRTLIAC